MDDDQLELFDPRPPPPAPDADLQALARRLPESLRFGTSSWTFPGWAGLVYHRSYPSKRDFTQRSLEEYARHPLFRTVGIDRSFYVPLSTSTLRLYAEQLPAGFRCAMKVWSEITTRVYSRHTGTRAGQINPAFLDPARFAEDVATSLEAAFLPHLGPLLVEIPPAPGKVNLSGFAARIDRFLREAPSWARFAFELRDPRLLTPAYLEVLRDHGATHVFNYWTAMPSLGDQLRRVGEIPGRQVVVRLMIPPGKAYSDLLRAFDPFDRLVAPQPAMREDVLRILDAAGERETYILVNNKAEGSSPLTVRALAAMVAAR